MEELRHEGNPTWILYRDFLWQGNPAVATREGLLRARKLRKEGKLPEALDLLLTLPPGEEPEPQVRYEMALIQLLQESRSPGEHLRADPAMGHLQVLVEKRQVDLVGLLAKEEQLKPDDYLYMGLHFLERTRHLQESGLKILEALVKRWPHSRAAKQANQKFRTLQQDLEDRSA
jgi:hypothetical protein